MADGHPAYLWWDGKRIAWNDANVHVSELGWSTVGAVFEGIRAYRSTDGNELYVYRLREHLERLARSMKLVRLPLNWSVDQLHQEIIDLLRANETATDTYIYPMGFAMEGTNKRWDLLEQTASLVIHTKPMASHLGTGMKYTAVVSSWRRISEDVMPPRVKNLSNYRNGQLARMDAIAGGYDTALLLNNQGKVAEAPGACVMLVRDNVVITPDLTSSVLESITRDALIQLAAGELGLKVEERQVDRTELYLADEVFLCGTAAEITPIVSVDRYAIGTGEIGPVTRKLEQAFEATLRGGESRRNAWRTPVGVGAGVGAD